MQVLNEPIDPSSGDKLQEVVCQTCSAYIRFKQSEALTETENITAKILTVSCPVCNSTVSKTLNKKVKERLVEEETHNLLPF